MNARELRAHLSEGGLDRPLAMLYGGERVAPEELADLQALLDQLKEGER